MVNPNSGNSRNTPYIEALPPALADFQRLNSRVYYRPPPSLGSRSDPPHQPDLILLLSWAGAHLRHAASYVAAHTRLFPRSALTLIRTDFPEMTYRSRAAQAAVLAPAVEAIRDAEERAAGEGRSSPNILLHTFSNGGAHTACYLARAYGRRFKPPSSFIASSNSPAPWAASAALPVSLIVIDSAPGGLSLVRNSRAIVVTLTQSRIVQLLLYPIVFTMLCALVVVWEALGRRGGVIRELRDGLNDVRMLGVANLRHQEDVDSVQNLGTSSRSSAAQGKLRSSVEGSLSSFGRGGGVRRVYIYSEGDPIVPAKDVEEHAQEAERKGFLVERLKYGRTSGHVAHAREDAERYWGAVAKAWEKVVG